MQDKDRRWFEILKQANATNINPVINDGVIQYVDILNNKTVWHIHILLDFVISYDDIYQCMTRVSSMMYSVTNIDLIRFSWHYRNPDFSKEYVQEYFEKAINYMGKRHNSLKVLTKYSKTFDVNKITFEVASVQDKTIINEAMSKIKDFFIDFGFEKLEYIVNLSKNEIDYQERREKIVSIIDEQADVRSYEQQTTEIELRRYEREKKTNKERKSSNAIKTQIDELPVTSMDVQEFRQIKGTDQVIVEGVLVDKSIVTRSKFHIFEGTITNYKDSIKIKRFFDEKDLKFYEKDLAINSKLSCRGSVQYDNYTRDVVIMCREITIMGIDDHELRIDASPVKRVELHAHSKMSVLDAVMDTELYVKAAHNFGMKAVALTDHANCHDLPEFYKECKSRGIKPIAGVEGYYVDDSCYPIALTTEDIPLQDATFVVFDLETTGFSINYNEIIEIGAVKIKNGMVVEEFSSFVKPKVAINKVITNVTGITNEDVIDAPRIEEILPKFVEFIKGAILVAHNASFDTEYIYENMRRLNLFEKRFPCIDTLQLAKGMYSNTLKRFNLKDVAKGLKVEVEEQHRALSDSHTTTNIFMRMLGDLHDLGILNYNQINSVVNKEEAFKYIIPSHINILVKNKKGLKNFYHIISDSHTVHFHKEARILKSVIEKYREGLLIGSGCTNGEIFKAAHNGSLEKLKEKMAFYDYIEVQPLDCYSHIVELSGTQLTYEHIKNTIKLIIKVAKEMGKIVVATGDVHHLNKEDILYRRIYTGAARPGGGLHDLAKIENLPNMYFRTTGEMLDSFKFIPEDLAYEIVVTNTNLISDMIEEYELFPKKLYTPRDDFMAKFGVPSMEKRVQELSYETAKSIYGDPLPKYVENRLEVELNSIIGNKFASIYYIAHILVDNSNKNGYVVGSRGSVGSSFVATMMGITEVNPLKPHYICKNCKFTAFKGVDEEHMSPELIEKLNKGQTGYDLPEYYCPKCGTLLVGQGIDIPFETFLGFKGDKVPDIDLNFSGEYQSKAHLFCREVFGFDNAIRAGTVTTIADKNAYGYVKGYFEENHKLLREAEISRLAGAITNVKRTTGQHPGGIVVIPDDIEYDDITPIQYPADDVNSVWRTTHFDYHKIEDNLLKLDILGHDDPTMIKRLMDFVYKYPEDFPFDNYRDIPINDKDVLSIFSSKDALKLKGEDIDEFKSGTRGIPEFGTNVSRDILNDMNPQTVDELIRISGLSHGENVWQGNAKDLIFALSMTDEPIPSNKVIGCRDDIMVDLMNYGIDSSQAFKIMEKVRKGKGLSTEDRVLMDEHNVPKWYQLSCAKIKYLFPKAHAAAYVIMALRIAWFKVHRPIYYYAAYFSCRANEFDSECFAAGKNALRNRINEINEKDKAKTMSNKEKDLRKEAYIALEMYLRGFYMKQVDIVKSDANDFLITEDKKGLLMPFKIIESLGESSALSVVEARNIQPFTSKKDVEKRTKLNRTTFNKLKSLGAMDELPDEDMNTML